MLPGNLLSHQRPEKQAVCDRNDALRRLLDGISGSIAQKAETHENHYINIDKKRFTSGWPGVIITPSTSRI